MRTKLVELIAHIRSDTGSTKDPPRDAVENAVNVVIHGRKSRVTVNTPQSFGSGPATVTTQPTDALPPWWKTTKALWTFAVGAAAIAAAVFADFELAE